MRGSEHKNVYEIIPKKLALALGLLLLSIFYFNIRSLQTSNYKKQSAKPQSSYVTGWGQNAFGQMGAEDNELHKDADGAYYLYINDIVQLAAGLNHTVALKKDGTVWSWGSNAYGQLGDGSTIWSRKYPVQVKGLSNVEKVAASRFHSLALKKDGTVWAWGSNMNNQLGRTGEQSVTPQQVAGLSDIVQIAAGYRFSLALKKDGTVWAWGGMCKQADTPQFKDFVTSLSSGMALEGTYFDPGDNRLSDQDELVDCLGENFVNINSIKPIKISGVSDITSISGGYGHMLALDRKGIVWAWGCNKYGQVGNGVLSNSARNMKPEKVQGLPPVVKIAAGYRHSLVVSNNGTVWAWGHNLWGELGTGSLKDSAVPKEVHGIDNVTDISGGHDFSLALTKDGSLWGWGENGTGVLGMHSEAVQQTPVKMKMVGQQGKIVAGGGHALMLPDTMVQ